MPDPGTYEKLSPVNKLTGKQRQQLIDKSIKQQLPPQSKLSADDERNWFVYLLEGKVKLRDRSGSKRIYEADLSHTCHPLFGEKTGILDLISGSDITIVKFDRRLFDMLSRSEVVEAETVVDILFDETESEVFEKIYQAYSNNELEVPALPDIAVKVRNAINKDSMSIVEVAHILEADPAITAELIKVANSAMMRGIEPVRSIQDAVLRVGLKTTRDLVILLTIKRLFNTQSNSIKRQMRHLYQHSVQVAALCYAFAKFGHDLEPERALLAGLLHDIGVIPIINYASKLTNIKKVEQELPHVIDKLKQVIGGMMLRQWNMEEEFIDAVENAEDWSRHTSDKVSYCDLVILSQLHENVRKQVGDNLPKITEVPIFNKVTNCSNDPECSQKILQIAHDEISEVMRLLSA